MEYWDIYDSNKQRTGRTMQRNDFTMKAGDYHLTVLGVIRRTDGKFLITQRALINIGLLVGGKFPAVGSWLAKNPPMLCAVKYWKKLV